MYARFGWFVSDLSEFLQRGIGKARKIQGIV